MDARARCSALLVRYGAQEIPHRDRNLLDHLVGTANLLQEWDLPQDVVLAGLCHAAYGTDGLIAPLVPLGRRSELAEAIGHVAERHVYLYGCCDRPAVYPLLPLGAPVPVRSRFDGEVLVMDDGDLSVFALITWANGIEVAQANTDFDQQGLKDLCTVTSHLVTPSARASARALWGSDVC